MNVVRVPRAGAERAPIISLVDEHAASIVIYDGALYWTSPRAGTIERLPLP